MTPVDEFGRVRALPLLAFNTPDLLHCSIDINIRFYGNYVKILLFYVQRSISRIKMKPGSVLIKKYGNRRLYDSSNSKYVNLDDIAGFIRNGKDCPGG